MPAEELRHTHGVRLRGYLESRSRQVAALRGPSTLDLMFRLEDIFQADLNEIDGPEIEDLSAFRRKNSRGP